MSLINDQELPQHMGMEILWFMLASESWEGELQYRNVFL